MWNLVQVNVDKNHCLLPLYSTKSGPPLARFRMATELFRLLEQLTYWSPLLFDCIDLEPQNMDLLADTSSGIINCSLLQSNTLISSDFCCIRIFLATTVNVRCVAVAQHLISSLLALEVIINNAVHRLDRYMVYGNSGCGLETHTAVLRVFQPQPLHPLIPIKNVQYQ